MIELLLNGNDFEQDIRELLMAFYPGEVFVQERQGQAFLTVEARLNQQCFFLVLTEAGLSKEGSVSIVPGNRTESKNRVKRLLYGMLCEHCNRELPWGSLTGIRPSKIAMTKLADGQSEAEIFAQMKREYLASDDKINLCIQVARRELSLMKQIDRNRGYSLYIGIPFCPTTCLYCSFTSFPIGKWENRFHLYLEALELELAATARRMKGRTLQTVYIGGGTPTSLPAQSLDWLISKVKTLFCWDQVQEFTVEAGRPDSITREKFQVLQDHGVTRISINPQTMKDDTLKLIGRRHSVSMVRESFALARQMGFDNINMDLIIGLPQEDLEDVRHTMEEIKALNPDSLTVHSLAIKRAARLHIDREQFKDLKMVNTQEMIDLTADYASRMGMSPYYMYRQKNMAGNFENVGYARPEKACIYNILIMEEQQTIVACGAGTTTKVCFHEENRRERVENVKDVGQYIHRIHEMIERKEKMLANLEMSDTMLNK